MPTPLPKPDLDAFPPSAVLVPGDPLFRALAHCHVIISQLLKCRWGWGLLRVGPDTAWVRATWGTQQKCRFLGPGPTPTESTF